MICYVCQKEIKTDNFQRLDSEHVRHFSCAPMTRNFKKAFPDAWTNKYVQKEKEEEVIIQEPPKPKRLRRVKNA